jgi:hypothetical protein
VPALQVSPIVAALDQPEVGLDRETVPRAALSLVEAFAEIPDLRHARGIRHGVLAIVLLGACAVLTGARSFAALAEYAHNTGRAILDLLGVGTVVPHASTVRRVLQDLDPDALPPRQASYRGANHCPAHAASARIGEQLESDDHEWPDELPAHRWGAPRTAYTRVRPDVVVEVSADLALDGLRWRHPVRLLRVHSDLRAADLHDAGNR